MIFNVLIIGAGNIASGYDEINSEMILTHAHAFKMHNGFNLIGFVDTNEQRATLAAKKWGTKAFYSLESAVEVYPYIDIFCIAVPDNMHFDILEKVSSHNPKFVFTEKPLTQTLSESYHIKNLYSQKNIPLMVNFKRAFIPEFKTLAKEINEGKFGVLRDCFGFYNRGFKHNASHLIDLFLRLTADKDLIFKYLLGEIVDYSSSDPSYSFIAKSNSEINFILKSYHGDEYPIFEIDLHFSSGRIRIINAGENIEVYKKLPSSFNGLSAIKHCESIPTSLNKSLLFSAQNIYNHLTFGEEIISNIDEAISVMRISESIINEIKK